jgi:hypothetical protein
LDSLAYWKSKPALLYKIGSPLFKGNDITFGKEYMSFITTQIIGIQPSKEGSLLEFEVDLLYSTKGNRNPLDRHVEGVGNILDLYAGSNKSIKGFIPHEFTNPTD